jgi:hypothetical protein
MNAYNPSTNGISKVEERLNLFGHNEQEDRQDQKNIVVPN